MVEEYLMQPVKSSNIHSIDHEGTTLKVQFKGKDGEPGPIWHYHDVPAHVRHEFLNAESKGGYFARLIKNNYKGVKHDGT
jgi:KTSC domain